MKIISWNVNGIRAATRKGFGDWLTQCDADVVALQEVRATLEQIPDAVRHADGYQGHFVAAERKGYSGVGLLSRTPPDQVETSLGIPAFDAEGRLQFIRFGALTLVNGYFPNGNGKNRDNSRVPYKLEFYRRLFAHLEPNLQRGEPILVMGDFNTAHREIDLARPKQNQKISGFLPEERAELDRWLAQGWTDTFRHFHDGPDHYTWWSQRFGVRAKNIGWRIDYVLASPGAMTHLQDAFILSDVMGSDHCPIGVDVADAICG